MAVEEIFLCNT